MSAAETKLPAGWVIAPLSSVVSGQGIFSDGDWIESKDQDPNGGVRLVQLADIGEMTFLDKSSRFLTIEKAEQLGCTFLKKGDLLISRLGDPLGKTCVYPGTDRRAVTAVDVCILRPACPELEPKLFGYFLNGLNLRQLIDAQSSGTTRKRITGKKLKALPVPIPPANEQHRIVEKIETLFAQLDKGEEAVREVLKLLMRYRHAVLRAAVTGELTADWRLQQHGKIESGSELLERLLRLRREVWEGRGKYKPPVEPTSEDLPSIPQNWAWGTLDQLVSGRARSMQSGPFGSMLKHSEFTNEGVLVLGIDNVKSGEFSTGSSNRISFEKYRQLKKYTARPSDLLVTVMASLGKSCVVPDDLETAIVTKHVYRITMERELVSPQFYNWLLQTEWVSRRHMFENSQGQTRPGLNGSILRSMPVPIPPSAEQLLIVQRLEAELTEIDRMENAIDGEKQRSSGLRHSILKDAFAGKLVEQDPRDEPAEMLLARIEEAGR